MDPITLDLKTADHFCEILLLSGVRDKRGGMGFAKLIARKYSYSEIEKKIEIVTQHIHSLVHPILIYLVGSVAKDEYSEYSDFDFVIVVKTIDEARRLTQTIHLDRPLREIPMDFVVLDHEFFQKMSSVGGMAFEARHHGKLIFKEKLK